MTDRRRGAVDREGMRGFVAAVVVLLASGTTPVAAVDSARAPNFEATVHPAQALPGRDVEVTLLDLSPAG